MISENAPPQSPQISKKTTATTLFLLLRQKSGVTKAHLYSEWLNERTMTKSSPVDSWLLSHFNGNMAWSPLGSSIRNGWMASESESERKMRCPHFEAHQGRKRRLFENAVMVEPSGVEWEGQMLVEVGAHWTILPSLFWSALSASHL